MDDLNTKLGELGVKQFVRNTFLGVIKAHMGDPKASEYLIDEVNEKLLSEFKRLAQEETTKLFEQIAELLKVEDKDSRITKI